MTRINSGISADKLTDQHLLAEHREIKRIPRTVFKSTPPQNFTLGTGHVLFFSDKHSYTYNRYTELYNECLKRGFNVEYYGDNWSIKSKGLDYTPTIRDRKLIKDRIIERISNSKQIPRYYGKNITIEEYLKIIT